MQLKDKNKTFLKLHNIHLLTLKRNIKEVELKQDKIQLIISYYIENQIGVLQLVLDYETIQLLEFDIINLSEDR